MPEGTYTLIIHLADQQTLTVGALGEHTFTAGYYAYTGSALGPGGFARLDRHRALAAGDSETRHWHIDYLLAAPAASIATTVTSPNEAIECLVAQAIPGDRIPDFGASDCHCTAHLVYQPTENRLASAVKHAHTTHEA